MAICLAHGGGVEYSIDTPQCGFNGICRIEVGSGSFSLDACSIIEHASRTPGRKFTFRDTLICLVRHNICRIPTRSMQCHMRAGWQCAPKADPRPLTFEHVDLRPVGAAVGWGRLYRDAGRCQQRERECDCGGWDGLHARQDTQSPRGKPCKSCAFAQSMRQRLRPPLAGSFRLARTPAPRSAHRSRSSST